MNKKITIEPDNSIWENGMMDKFVRGMYWQIKFEAEQMYSKDIDKSIRALRLHQSIIITLAYIANLADMDIYCELNDMNKPSKSNLHLQLSEWLDFKHKCGLKELKYYFDDRAATVMKEEERLKKEEEDCKDE